jgi:hypothetical protein
MYNNTNPIINRTSKKDKNKHPSFLCFSFSGKSLMIFYIINGLMVTTPTPKPIEKAKAI